MARAATHLGHCQVCGRLHKLPGGKVSKHGYTVEHRGQGGYFSGVCRASDALPYEQDCGLLQEDIEHAKTYLANIPARIEELLASESLTVTLNVRTDHYGAERWPVSGEITLTGQEFFQDRFALVDADGKQWKFRNNDYRLKTPLDFCKDYRAGIVKNLQREAEVLRIHIEEQGKRLAAWKPNQPLKPIGRG
jgi:hypothetical protein